LERGGHIRREVGQDEIRPGSLDGEKRFIARFFEIEPAPLRSGMNL
jgi:hypothetical protein